MPIQINLLAEQQAAEEMRRKDPVKRAIWAASALAGLLVSWCLYLQFQIWRDSRALAQSQAEWKSTAPGYNRAHANLVRTEEIRRRLTALERFTTNRFLWGNVLNALQQVKVPHVQLSHFSGVESYQLTEAVKPKTNYIGQGEDRKPIIVPGKPPTSKEQVKLTVEGRDYSNPAGGQVNHYREALAALPYFRDRLKQPDDVRLIGRSPPQHALSGDPRVFVAFTVEAVFPERIRRGIVPSKAP